MAGIADHPLQTIIHGSVLSDSTSKDATALPASSTSPTTAATTPTVAVQSPGRTHGGLKATSGIVSGQSHIHVFSFQ